MAESSRSDLDVTRAQLQERLERMMPAIERRIGLAPDRLLNSLDFEDLMASSRRRLDELLLEGRIEVRDDQQLEALFVRMLRNRITDEARRELRRRRAEAAAARAAASKLETFADDAAHTLATILARLRPEDRTTLELRARGMTLRRSAEQLGVSVDTQRSRWRRLCGSLRREA